MWWGVGGNQVAPKICKFLLKILQKIWQFLPKNWSKLANFGQKSDVSQALASCQRLCGVQFLAYGVKNCTLHGSIGVC